MKPHLPLTLLLALGALLPASGQDAGPVLSGSMAASALWTDPGWYAANTAQAVLAADGPAARYRVETVLAYDLTADRWSAVLDEAWAEGRPLAGVGIRLGRFRPALGPGLAFSPANPFSGKDPFDPRAGARGRDGLRLEGDAGPLVASAAVFLPTDQAPPVDLDRSSGVVTAVVILPEFGFLGSTEVGATAAARNFASGTVLGGAWISADLDGLVAGVEGCWDEGSPVAAFGVNRTFGEVFAAAEARYTGRDRSWTGFARLSWTRDDFGAAATVLADSRTTTLRSALEASWDAGEVLTFEVRASGTLTSPLTLGLGARWYY